MLSCRDAGPYPSILGHKHSLWSQAKKTLSNIVSNIVTDTVVKEMIIFYLFFFKKKLKHWWPTLVVLQSKIGVYVHLL